MASDDEIQIDHVSSRGLDLHFIEGYMFELSASCVDLDFQQGVSQRLESIIVSDRESSFIQQESFASEVDSEIGEVVLVGRLNGPKHCPVSTEHQIEPFVHDF